MKLSYILNKELPKLAWCAIISKKSSEVEVHHGIGIDTDKSFFVEGAWNGDFDKAQFDTASFFMGSGGKIVNQGLEILFSTPNHTFERLYSYKDNDIMFVSNSLPFLLYMSDEDLDLNYSYYEDDLNSILKGINQYEKFIVLEDNKQLQLHYYCNIYIDQHFNIVETSKPKTEDFISYDDYHSSLIRDLKLFVKNANHHSRKYNYEMVTTISKGYDSCACAAVAVELGCEIAVSFDRPVKYAEDCGDEIAEDLGFKEIITKNANIYLENLGLIESEFVSSGNLGSGIVFTAFENEFKNKMVFIGLSGDSFWDKNSMISNNEFRFDGEITSETSMIENRLKVGYIAIFMAAYRAENWQSIHQISNSAEMKNFSVGGNYDRPIPRRIIETKGIKRGEFGVEKKGAGINYRFDNLMRLKKRMSPESFNSFYKYYQNNKKKFSIKRMILRSKYFWGMKNLYLSYLLRKIRVSYKCDFLRAVEYPNLGAPYYLFFWGNYVMKNRYKESNINRWWLNS